MTDRDLTPTDPPMRDDAGVPLDYPVPPPIGSSLPEPGEGTIVDLAPVEVPIEPAPAASSPAASADTQADAADAGETPTATAAEAARKGWSLWPRGRTKHVEAPVGIFGEGDDWYAVAEEKRKKTYRYLVIGGGVALLVSLAAIVGYLQFGTATVPDLVGMSSANAANAIREAGLNVGAIEERETPGVEPGTVVDQHPDVDSVVPRGSEVSITIAVAGNSVSVPALSSKTREAAVAALASARLNEQVVIDYSETVPAGQVMAQVPSARTVVEAGSSVAIVVSGGSGAKERTIPRVIGLGGDTAAQALIDAGFVPRLYTARTDVGSAGSVVAQLPGSDQKANPGATVLVLVARAVTADETEVPDVTSLTEAEAATKVGAIGSELEVAPFASDTAPAGTVIGQLPLAERCTLTKDEKVGVLVSAGPSDAVNAPELIGLGLGAALSAVREASLTPVIVLGANGEKPGMTSVVTQQYPAPSVVLRLGLPIVLFAEPAAAPTK